MLVTITDDDMPLTFENSKKMKTVIQWHQSFFSLFLASDEKITTNQKKSQCDIFFTPHPHQEKNKKQNYASQEPHLTLFTP